MKEYCLLIKYNCKEFMNVKKLIEFKYNIEELERNNIKIKLLFYGEASEEELATFMSYFNKLVGKKICDISISLTTKELIEEKGLNNRRVKISAQKAIDIRNEHVQNIIKDYYKQNVIIKTFSTDSWERNILYLIGA